MYTVLVTSLSLSLSFHYFLTKEGNSCISFATDPVRGHRPLLTEVHEVPQETDIFSSSPP